MLYLLLATTVFCALLVLAELLRLATEWVISRLPKQETTQPLEFIEWWVENYPFGYAEELNGIYQTLGEISDEQFEAICEQYKSYKETL